MAIFSEFQFENSRGQKLAAVEYLPENGVSTACLFWHHGIAEHVGRYVPVFNKIAESGIAVYAYDAHNHGKSDNASQANEKALIWSFSHLIDDLYQFVDVVTKRSGELPTKFLGGQSMGALVSAHAVLRKPEPWAGLIFHSAALDIAEWTLAIKAQAAVGNVLASLIPRSRIVPAVKPEDMSAEPEVVKNYVEDPLNFVGKIRARTANEILKGFKQLAAKESAFTLPIYAVHGTKDHTTSIEAVRRFCKNVASRDVTLVEIDGGYHELLMGSIAPGNAAKIAQWINKQVAAPKL